METSRAEYIRIFKERMCTICRSKYCRHKIRISHRNGITTIKCNEYNKRYERTSEKSNSL